MSFPGVFLRMDLGVTFRHNLPRLQLTTRDDGHVTILTVDGDLVIGESESLFKKTITRLLETGKVNLLVDLRRVGFLDSSGLGALVRAMTMSQNRRHSFRSTRQFLRPLPKARAKQRLALVSRQKHR